MFLTFYAITFGTLTCDFLSATSTSIGYIFFVTGKRAGWDFSSGVLLISKRLR